MRTFLTVVGVVWGCSIFFLSYTFSSRAARARPPAVLIHPRAPSPAPQPPAAFAPASTPLEAPLPEPAAAAAGDPAPEPGAAPGGAESRIAPPEPYRPADGRLPLPAFRPPPTLPEPDLPAPTGEEGSAGRRSPELGVCLLCEEAAESWVEAEGRRYGYCRRHLGSPEQPDGRRTASVPCRGVTRGGTPCRRKTADPGGFCYQHRK